MKFSDPWWNLVGLFKSTLIFKTVFTLPLLCNYQIHQQYLFNLKIDDWASFMVSSSVCRTSVYIDHWYSSWKVAESSRNNQNAKLKLMLSKHSFWSHGYFYLRFFFAFMFKFFNFDIDENLHIPFLYNISLFFKIWIATSYHMSVMTMNFNTYENM